MVDTSTPTDISSLAPLRDIIRTHELRAEKKLGQNFLLDLNLTDKIARAAGDLTDCTAIEIGPGPGGLTRSLVTSNAKHVIAIEFDPRAIKALQSLKEVAGERLTLIEGDALNIDLTSLCEGPRAIVANLPYNIATPLLVGWLKQLHEDPNTYRSMTLMFQKEVVQRITADENTKAYGRLGILSQWLCRTSLSFDVPASAFTPPPKVTSSIGHFKPYTLEQADKPNFKTMEKLTAQAFGQRRKMIRSSMKDYIQYFEELGLNPESRAETLSVKDFINLAKLINKA